jgi:hypothetical protein
MKTKTLNKGEMQMKNLLGKCLFVLFLFFLWASVGAAGTAYWDHSESPEVVKYKVSWGNTPGNYAFNQEMQKSECVDGVDPQGDAYNCKMLINATFTENVPYYFVAYAIAYKPDGSEFSSPPTPEVVYIKRPDGTTTNVPPKPVRGLGIYDQ